MVETPASLVEQIRQYVAQPFGTFVHQLQLQVRKHPQKIALMCNGESLSYRDLDALSDRVATGLQWEKVGRGGVVSICSAMSIPYVVVFLGMLKTGAAVSPLSPSSTPAQLVSMLKDSGATHLFLDRSVSTILEAVLPEITARRIGLEEGANGIPPFSWMPRPLPEWALQP